MSVWASFIMFNADPSVVSGVAVAVNYTFSDHSPQWRYIYFYDFISFSTILVKFEQYKKKKKKELVGCLAISNFPFLLGRQKMHLLQ